MIADHEFVFIKSERITFRAERSHMPGTVDSQTVISFTLNEVDELIGAQCLGEFVCHRAFAAMKLHFRPNLSSAFYLVLQDFDPLFMLEDLSLNVVSLGLQFVGTMQELRGGIGFGCVDVQIRKR